MRNSMTVRTLIAPHLGLMTAAILILAGLIFVPTAAAQDHNARQLTVVAQMLNVRSGPGLAYPAFDVLKQGDQVAILNYNTASNWWQVQLPSGSAGWVSGGPAYVSVDYTSLDVPASTSSQALQPIDNSQFTIQSQRPPMGNSQSPPLLVFQTVSGGPIYAINADGSNLRYLTVGMDPALSPDGQWVAFTRWDNPQTGALGSLWVIKVDGSGERRVMENVFQPKSPTWSPDGTEIILSMAYGEHLTPLHKCSGQRPPRNATNVERKVEGKGDVVYCFDLPATPNWGLRRVNVATGQFEDLNYDTNSISPAWDPANSGRLIYDGQRGLISLDLTKEATVPLTTDALAHSPVFSPDGSKIAVSYLQNDHWEIHVLNADGSGDVRLTETSYLDWVQQELNGQAPHSYNNAAPAWSPDGSQLAFLTDRTGQWEIWVMNIDGSHQRPFFPPEILAGIALQYNGMEERVLSWR